MELWFTGETHSFGGLRAGWRFALFLILLVAPMVALQLLASGRATGGAARVLTPAGTAFGELVSLAWVVLVTWLFARLEHRRLGHFGLPARRAFQGEFWQGAAWGVVSLTVLLALIALSGAFEFGHLANHGAVLARYAAAWAVAFLAVGFFEEFCFRGYALVTLNQGMGFWPAAALVSVLFGAVHLGNTGESYIGALSAGLIGLFFCFTWRRTGSLWFAVGMHAAWDYCESFVYGVPDSGLVTPGRMLAPATHGSRWITGGSVGPEGSLWVFVVIALLFVAFDRLYPAGSSPSAPSTASSDASSSSSSAPEPAAGG